MDVKNAFATQDFLKKCIDTKLIGNAKGYNLIKSGCFDKMGDRKALMKKYVEHITPLKTGMYNIIY